MSLWRTYFDRTIVVDPHLNATAADLRAMREAYSEASHVCEPPSWPDSLDEVWTCPECGQCYLAARLVDEPSLRGIRGHVPDTLGWRSQAVTE